MSKSSKCKASQLKAWEGRSQQERSSIALKGCATKKKNGAQVIITTAMIEGQKKAWKDPKKRVHRIKALKLAWKRNYEERCRIQREVSGPKQSRAMKGKDPIGRPRGGRIVWYKGLKGIFAMRSKSEVKYAKFLDRLGIDWMYESFTFQCGKKQTWTPDFYLPKFKVFIEIKGWLLSWIKRKINKIVKHFSNTKFVMINSKTLPRLTSGFAYV